MSYQPFSKFLQFAKVDETTHETYCPITAEVQDSENEICSYVDQVPYYREWESAALSATTKAGQRESRGNIRLQHAISPIAGKVVAIDYRDDAREIWLRTRPTSDVWPLIRDGFVTGMSAGGQYVRRWHGDCGTEISQGHYCPTCEKGDVPIKFCARIAECSYVDKPAVGIATFTYVKADGATEMRKFRSEPQSDLTSDLTGFEDQFFLSYPAEKLTGFEIGLSLADRLFGSDEDPVPVTYGDDSTGFEGL